MHSQHKSELTSNHLESTSFVAGQPCLLKITDAIYNITPFSKYSATLLVASHCGTVKH